MLADGTPCWELLRAARLATAGAERKHAYQAISGDPISAAADIRAMGLLKQLCQKALSTLPTALQEDIQQLRSLRCDTSRTQLAVQWRICYKGTLQRCIALCERAQTFLQQPGLNPEQHGKNGTPD